MRYLVLTDIHGNLDALDAVLAHAGPVDSYLILGDLVGYGAEPNAVIERVLSLQPRVVIRGNHDKVASGLELPESFNPAALRAAAWTLNALAESNREWLEALPEGPVLVDELVEVCHGSPDHEDDYIFSAADAHLAFLTMRRRVCFFGHTHVPAGYWASESDGDRIHLVDVQKNGPGGLRIEPDRRYLLNPGAVGQPRDGDPRAAYAIYDSDARSVIFERVAYAVEEAQARIIAAGLPEVLARRLGLGR